MGLFLERTGSGDRGRNGCEKRTHKDQRGTRSFIKTAAGLVSPAFKLVAEPDAGAAGNLGGGMDISQTWYPSD